MAEHGYWAHIQLLSHIAILVVILPIRGMTVGLHYITSMLDYPPSTKTSRMAYKTPNVFEPIKIISYNKFSTSNMKDYKSALLAPLSSYQP